MTTLDNLIRNGATLTEYGVPNSTRPLAAAAWKDGVLWFCDLWPENEFAQHKLTGTLSEDGDMLILRNENYIVAVIAPMETDERESAMWAKWDSSLPAYDFAADLRSAFLNS